MKLARHPDSRAKDAGDIVTVQTGADNGVSIEETADAVKTEPVIYTKTGEALKPESGANLSVSV